MGIGESTKQTNKKWLSQGSVLFGLALVLAGIAIRGYLQGKGHRFESPDNYIKYSYRLQNKNEISKEISFYKERLERNPQSALDMASLARAYFAKGKSSGNTQWYDKAESLASESLRLLDYSNYGAKLVLSGIAHAQHDFDKVTQITSNVLKASPFHVGALSQRITSYLATGELEKANKDADRYYDIRPVDAAHTLRGLVMEARGRDAEALFHYHMALKLEEAGARANSAWVRCLLARFHTKWGNYGTARPLLEESLRLVPNYAMAKDLLASLEEQQGDFEQAASIWKETFTLTKSPIFLVKQAAALDSDGQSDSATQLRKVAIDIFQDETQSSKFGHRDQLARALLDRGSTEDIRQALDLLKDLTKKRRDHQTVALYARALAQSSKWKLSRVQLRKVLQTGYVSAQYFALAAIVEKAQGSVSLAKHYMKRARDILPDSDRLRRQEKQLFSTQRTLSSSQLQKLLKGN